MVHWFLIEEAEEAEVEVEVEDEGLDVFALVVEIRWG